MSYLDVYKIDTRTNGPVKRDIKYFIAKKDGGLVEELTFDELQTVYQLIGQFIKEGKENDNHE